jgi:hypothetical protein
LQSILKISKMSADSLVTKYDKDKSYLLSVKELKKVFEDLLSYKFSVDDEAMLSQHLKKMFGRDELKRAEFKQLIEM